MLRKLFSVCIAVSGCVIAYGQDSTMAAPTGPTITGSLDVYYRYNFSDPASPYNNFTSFTNSQKSYELGMASIRADHSFGKASATLDLGFGRRAEEFSYTDGSGTPIGSGNGLVTLSAIKQAYLSYALSSKVKLTMGKWATHVGYELVDAYLNRNYSMSYMFSYGPFFHTGLKADIGLGGKSNLMIGIANPTDFSTTTSSRKFAIAQFSTASSNDKFKAYLNYQGTYGGSLDLTQFDVVLTAALTDKFSLGYNGTVQSQAVNSSDGNSWWGSALYVNADPSDKFGITLRGEYFSNKKAVVAAPATNIFDLTLSPNIKAGNLTIIPEIRFETSKDEIYSKNDGGSSKSTVSAILAAVYHF